MLRPGFVADTEAALTKLAARTGRCAAIVGFVDSGRDLHNAAAVCAHGAVLGTYRKRILPNYAVFDEARYFTPGDLTDPLELYVIAGVRVGVSICEDAWSPNGPIAAQAAGGAELVVNINASPYAMDKAAPAGEDAGHPGRRRLLRARLRQPGRRAGRAGLRRRLDGVRRRGRARRPRPAVHRGPPGGGPRRRRRSTASACSTPAAGRPGPPCPRSRSARSRPGRPAPGRGGLAPLRDHAGEVYDALVLGLRDYALKNGFRDVVLGLSGGIDSSLVAAIAADALGPEHVHGVSMPSRYSSDGSRSDAEALATAIGCDYRTIAIEPAFAAFLDLLAPSFAGREPDLTEENLQSRIRGMLLMALSNKFGWLVLTTGNKSEMAVGYSTLYGDSAGGFAVIKDVYKTTVYKLCRYVNDTAGREIIPEAVFVKPPSAELRPGPARRPEPPALRGPRPHPQGLRGGRSARRRRSSPWSETRPRCGASPASSTWPSTSVARPLRASA